MNEKIVVSVGMGCGQYEFIKKLTDKGYKVAAFGKGKNSDEAIMLCDYSALIDTADFENAIQWIESLGKDVLAVGSYAGGVAVHTVQKISNYFNVPTAVPDEFIIDSDKIRQQKLYSKYHLSSIETWKLSDLTDSKLSYHDLYILKPIIGRGSEDIRIVSKIELMQYLCDKITVNKETIVQVVHKGIEYRCVIIVQMGEIKLLAPILRISYRDTLFLGCLSYSENHLVNIEQFISKFVKESGIVNAIFKADIIVSDHSIDVIEMDIGVGGGSYYKEFVSRLYERNMMDEYIKLITNQPIDKFVVSNPNLRMDYVFNHRLIPVKYDINECKRLINDEFGLCEIQINLLHPEDKGGFKSNADFIFAIIYQNKYNENRFLLDDFVNERLLYEKDNK